MTQRARTVLEVRAVMDRVTYEDKEFRLGQMADGCFLQVEYMEPDVRTGAMAVQRGRKWYVSPYATDSEIVQTMLTAALASAEHQCREHFRYAPSPGEKSHAIFGPHFSADALYSICGIGANYDARDDPE